MSWSDASSPQRWCWKLQCCPCWWIHDQASYLSQFSSKSASVLTQKETFPAQPPKFSSLCRISCFGSSRFLAAAGSAGLHEVLWDARTLPPSKHLLFFQELWWSEAAKLQLEKVDVSIGMNICLSSGESRVFCSSDWRNRMPFEICSCWCDMFKPFNGALESFKSTELLNYK